MASTRWMVLFFLLGISVTIGFRCSPIAPSIGKKAAFDKQTLYSAEVIAGEAVADATALVGYRSLITDEVPSEDSWIVSSLQVQRFSEEKKIALSVGVTEFSRVEVRFHLSPVFGFKEDDPSPFDIRLLEQEFKSELTPGGKPGKWTLRVAEAVKADVTRMLTDNLTAISIRFINELGDVIKVPRDADLVGAENRDGGR